MIQGLKLIYLMSNLKNFSRLLPTAPCLARILDEPVELRGYHLQTGVSL